MLRDAYIVFAVLLLATACVDDSYVCAPQEQYTCKIINPEADAVAGFLMVCLTESASTPSFEDVANMPISVAPLFPRKSNSHSALDRWLLLEFDPEVDVRALAEHLAQDSRIEKIEFSEFIEPVKPLVCQPVELPAAITRSEEMPFNDPYLVWQWHYNNNGKRSAHAKSGADINLFEAWKYTAGDNRVVVAVIDGGIRTDHIDLADNMWVNEAERDGEAGVDDDGNGYVDDIHGYNFYHDKGEISPDTHGTHVAGTIAAVNNNDYCVSGIAGGTGKGDGVKIMSCQIFYGDRGTYSHNVARAIRYAADNGAVIANNSWGYPAGDMISDSMFKKYDKLVYEAFEYFETEAQLDGVIDGGIIIFAAGNESTGMSSYPAAYHDYISVSAMGADYTATYYTNYGPGVNICAPGGNVIHDSNLGVLSTSANSSYGYEVLQGTSMACPHVSGCAALGLSYALQKGYSFTADEFRSLLLTSVHDIDQYQTGLSLGYDSDKWEYYQFDLATYRGNLGAGYIDAHLLLMQIENTPCLYTRCGEMSHLPLDSYFGESVGSMHYKGCDIDDDTAERLGITDTPIIVDGHLRIRCNNPGTGRVTVRAVVGGDEVSGGDSIGGTEVEREFEVVVRGSVANNGAWL